MKILSVSDGKIYHFILLFGWGPAHLSPSVLREGAGRFTASSDLFVAGRRVQKEPEHFAAAGGAWESHKGTAGTDSPLPVQGTRNVSMKGVVVAGLSPGRFPQGGDLSGGCGFPAQDWAGLEEQHGMDSWRGGRGRGRRRRKLPRATWGQEAAKVQAALSDSRL